ncbi:MAG: molybdopterin molybdotransferase MoeA, partial [Proteobacteria bacterium]|nr:molybdopterin molybdotransferase MoeA [Pseudomonadota bacterium]
MVTVEEALRRVLGSISPLGLEKVNILDTLGRVLGEDIYADRDIPPNDNSAMDGYALNSEDTMGASGETPIIFDVIEDIPAGYLPQKIVGFAETARIMTGAPIPEGANAVVRVEDTEQDDNRVKIFVEAVAGQDVRFAGEDVKKGALVLPRGKVIRPAETGMLASLGRSSVYVYQKPLVAVLATGDELTDIDGALSPGKIISSNSYSIAAQVTECGGIPLHIGIAKDTKDDL